MRLPLKASYVTLCIVFIICVAGGIRIVQGNKETDPSHTNPLSYPQNEYGQTYGSAAEATPIGMLPDLIYSGSVNGIAAYVLKQDYLSELSRDVPLYEVSGKAIIGSYRISAKNVTYPKNKNGQTYGSSADAASSETSPELIRAIGVGGTKGYVLKTDLDGKLPTSPEEAISMQNSRPPGGREIPLYDVDGETILDVFQIK
ncbi:hypothetical protein SAMN02799630_00932 [Paenibacillus sp. UNCCL117]|uniref:hypothetical protein n=1 Tax=unclassified Paenibacillus TaxID=185978 RepID=UPI00088708D1|nr:MULTISPECIES: hypothetical protein [unclassified Paenibacillus]SDC25690.1 hypothetical protein SAMN04488602_101734 [Paenibacillus sp. cl123]SFW19886.1 hypothetical protein SAMN02799630_00932 [Paenibacillus sp. UNCCL117]